MRQMSEIATVFESQNYSINNIICDTMKKFKFKTLCHKAGIQKAAGFSATKLLTLLIMLPLMAIKNVHQLYKSTYAKKVAMQKDALYRMKNNERHPWRSLLYAVAKRFKELAGEGNEQKDTITALILDDTIDQRVGYKIENVSRVFDHVLKKTVYGLNLSACIL